MFDEMDPDSPIPLYHQIAEALRDRIRAGDLAPGDTLEPMRDAARRWGVNLHTVRHAYTALAREGWVQSEGRRGTRVTGKVRPRPKGPAERHDLDRLAARMVAEAERRLGVGAAELAAAVQRIASRDDSAEVPVAWVVECSEWECRSHAREIRDRFAVDARAWPLDRDGSPPAGDIVIATYFHYNDIRVAWPARLSEVRFVTIRPDPRLATLLPEPAPSGERVRVLVCERDEPTAQIITADLSQLLPSDRYDLRTTVFDAPDEVFDSLGADDVALFAPRVFAQLDDSQRSRPGVLEARYVFDEAELLGLARDLDWQPARLVGHRGG